MILGFLLRTKSLRSSALHYLVVQQLRFGRKQSVTVLTLEFYNRTAKRDLLGLGSQPL